MDLNLRFGVLLRDFRLRIGMTQEELAEASGISARTISLLETGRRGTPRLVSVRLLAQALALTVEDRESLLAATRGVPRFEARERVVPARPGVGAEGVSSFLPAEASAFVGRGPDLDRLRGGFSGRSGRAVAVATVDGMAGVGKTAFAVHAGHVLAPDYPDGQFFCDLRGFTPGRRPMDPVEALEALLGMLGVPAGALPAGRSERAVAWRVAAGRRRALLVLDNAASTDQIRPLLPAVPGFLVIVTSRCRLPALEGAVPLSLDVLSLEEAVQLFAQVAGPDRVEGARGAVEEIVDVCGRLPMAVRIAASRLAHRPSWTPAHLVARLRDQERRLAELSIAGVHGLSTAFTLSYLNLDRDCRELVRLLGAHLDEEFDCRTAAVLAGCPPRRAEDLLERLVDHHLLLQAEPGRYSFHGLVRDYVRSLPPEEPNPPVQASEAEASRRPPVGTTPYPRR